MSKKKKNGVWISRKDLKDIRKCLWFEKRLEEVEGKVFDGDKGNDTLWCAVSKLRHSIPLSSWEERYRLLYPQFTHETIMSLVAQEAADREKWLARQIGLDEQKLVGVQTT